MIFFPNKALNRIQIYYIILTIQVNKSQPDKVPLGEAWLRYITNTVTTWYSIARGEEHTEQEFGVFYYCQVKIPLPIDNNAGSN